MNQMKQIELVRGMRDLLPTATPLWRRVEDIARDCFAAYGYDEIRLPVVEKRFCLKAVGRTYGSGGKGDVFVCRRGR